jgi:hypothetical protein
MSAAAGLGPAVNSDLRRESTRHDDRGRRAWQECRLL